MRERFFAKRVRKYCLILCIPTIFIWGVLLYQTNHLTNNDLKTQGQYFLSNVDEAVNSSIYNTFEQQNIMMGDPRYSLALKKLLKAEALNYSNYVFMGALNSFVVSYKTAHSFIDSVYVYVDGGNYLMTSENTSVVLLDNFYDNSWLVLYENMSKDDDEYLVDREIQRYSFEGGNKVISVFERMKFREGVLIVNISYKSYDSMVQSLLTSEEQIYCLINTNGEVLYCNDEDKINNSSFLESLKSYNYEFYKDEKNVSTSGYWIKLNNKRYFFSEGKSKYFNSYQITLIPERTYFNKIAQVIGWMAIVFVVDIMVIIIISWITTKRSFTYIDECISIFSSAEKGMIFVPKEHQKQKDEYSMILNNIIFMYLNNNQMNIELTQKQHQNELAELRALQLQMNPHFLFNTLQTIDMEVIRHEGVQSTTHEIVQKLCGLIYYSFKTPMELISIGNELECLSDYFRIQEIRFSNCLIWYYEVQEEVTKCKIFRMLLQPIVENCITHGLNGKGKIVIKIKIYIKDNMLCFCILDSGCGMSKEDLNELSLKMNGKETQRIGLANVNRRLIINYGVQSALKVFSKAGMGTIVQFKIPFQIE